MKFYPERFSPGTPDETLLVQLSRTTIEAVLEQLSPMIADLSARLGPQQAQSSPLRTDQLGSSGAGHSPANGPREQPLQQRDMQLVNELRVQDNTNAEVFMAHLTQVLDEERSDNHVQVQFFSVFGGPLRARGFVLALMDIPSVFRHAHDLHIMARPEWFRQFYGICTWRLSVRFPSPEVVWPPSATPPT